MGAAAYIAGEFNGWNTTANEINSTGVSLPLMAGTTYEFKIVDNGTWYGKTNGAITSASTSVSSFSSSGGNCKITTTCAGDYTFKWSSYTVTVTYPSARTFQSGQKIYFKDTWQSSGNGSTWKTGSGNVYAYFSGDGTAWSTYGDLVSGSWNADGAIYEITVPGSGKAFTTVYFTRGLNTSTTWNRTTDQTAAIGRNMFSVSNTAVNSQYTGSWGKYAKTPAVLGEFNNWDPDANVISSKVTIITLPASTTYRFTVLDGETYYANTLHATITNTMAWEQAYAGQNDYTMTSAEAGDYCFMYDNQWVALYYPQARLAKQKYIYLDTRPFGTGFWNTDNASYRFYFKHYNSGDDIGNVTSTYNSNRIDDDGGRVFPAQVPNSDDVGRIQLNRYNSAGTSQWGSDASAVIYASGRTSTAQNCMLPANSVKDGSWSGWTTGWTTYCPIKKTSTITDNGTVKTWGGSGTSGSPYYVAAGSNIKVSSASTDYIEDANMSTKYDFQVRNTSDVQQAHSDGVATTYEYTTPSTNNVTYKVRVNSYNYYNSTSSTEKWSSDIYYNARTPYNIAYKKGSNGTGTEYTDVKLNGIAITLRGAIFTRTGYTQTAWNTNSAGTGGTSYTLSSSYTTNAAKTLYPTWTANTTTITLNANTSYHGSAAGSASVTYDATALTSISHATPAAGWFLEGYYTAANSGNKILNADGTLVRNTTYTTDEATPKWKGTASSVTLYPHYIPIWRIAGSDMTDDDDAMGNWSTETNQITNITTSAGVMTSGSVTVNLDANTEYKFKVVNASDNHWWGNSGTITNIIYTNRTTNTPTLSDNTGNDQTFRSAAKGTYTFTWNVSSSTITITYPTSYKITIEHGYWNAANDIGARFDTGTGGTVTSAVASVSGSLAVTNTNTVTQYVGAGETVTFTHSTANSGWAWYAWGSSFNNSTKSVTQYTNGSGGVTINDGARTMAIASINADKTVYGFFKENVSTITVNTANSNYGDLKIGGAASSWGTSVTLGATTTKTIKGEGKNGYMFTTWALSGAATKASGNLTDQQITIKGNGTASSTGTATASFAPGYVIRGSLYDDSGNGGLAGWDNTTAILVPNLSTGVGTYTATLQRGKRYKFKVYFMEGSGFWRGTSETSDISSGVTYTLPDGGNDITFTAGANGTYTFTYNFSTKALTVTYPTAYSVTYHGNGSTSGSVPTDATPYASGETVNVQGNLGYLAKSNYTLSGWNTTEHITGTTYGSAGGESFTITANTNLYAKWTHAISLDKNGGTGSSTVTATYNSSTLTDWSAPTRTGYTFAGYWTSETSNNGSGTLVINTSGVLQANVSGYTGAGGIWTSSTARTLYAKWTENSYSVTFYNGGHGTVAVAGATIANGGSATITQVNSKTLVATASTGYDFNGWTKTGGAVIANTSSASTSITATAAGTVTANWTAHSYTISYDLAGGSVATPNPTSYTVESSAITLNNPTRDNYVFAGWTGTDLGGATTTVTIPAGSTGNRSYTATWTEAEASLEVGGATTYYATVAEAFTAASATTSTSTMTILKDATVTTQLRLGNSDGRNCTLNLNGHTITSTTSSQYPLIVRTSGGSLTITDETSSKLGRLDITTSFSGSGKNVNPYAVYVYAGTLNLDAGTIAVSCSTDTIYGVAVRGSQTFTMNGGAVDVSATSMIGYGVSGNGTTTINNGTIKVEAYKHAFGITRAGGTLTVTGGKFDISSTNATAYIAAQSSANAGLSIQGGYYSNNKRLDLHVTAPKYVFATTAADKTAQGSAYNYKVTTGYVITYNAGANGTGTVDAGTKAQGDDFTLSSSTFTRTGYTQTGWSTSDGGSKTYNLGGTYSTDAAITLYPFWGENSYDITFYNGGHGTVAVGGVTVANGGTAKVNHFTTKTLVATASTGYTFNGWTIGGTNASYVTIANTSAASTNIKATKTNATVTANWTANTYSITLDKNGGDANGSATATYDATTLSSISAPTKTGYSVEGYYLEAGCTNKVATAAGALQASKTYTDASSKWISTSNQTLYTKWTANNYTVNYSAPSNGNYTIKVGSGSASSASKTANYQQTITLAATPSTGYHFVSWTVTKAGGGTITVTSNQFSMPADDVTVTATFAINTYAISYAAGTYGSGSLAGGSKTHGVAYTLSSSSSAFTRTGYTYDGWSTNAAGSSKDYNLGGSYTTNAAQTFYPHWVVTNYTISYDLAGGSVVTPNPTSYTVESSAITLNNPTKTGYTFAGWTGTGLASATMSVTIAAGSTGNRSYTATWTANTNTPYTVNHYKQNLAGDGYDLVDTDNLTGTTGASVTPAVKSYTGFTAPSTQTVTILADGSRVVTYNYTRNSYTLTWALDGGSISSAGTAAGSVKYGAPLTAPTVTKTGYTFSAWSPTVPATMPAANSTYTATWSEKSYNVTFYNGGHGTVKVNGSTVANGTTASVNHFTTKTLSATASTGYTFAGWTKTGSVTLGNAANASTTITATATGGTVTATWTANAYNITYKDQGNVAFTGVHGDGYPTTHTYGTATALVSPTKTGYTFGGWYTTSACTGDAITYVGATAYTADFTLYAKWTINSYTITFDSNGGSAVASITQNYGTAVVAPANPTKTGYEFAGWSPAVPSTMPAENTTCVAQWTAAVASVAISGGSTTYYSTVTGAFTAANAATAASTITMLNHASVTSALTYNNSNTQNCTLDLNGYTLTSTTSSRFPLQINMADVTFTITDNSVGKAGKLSITSTQSGSTIFGAWANVGNLVLEAGTIEALSSTQIIAGATAGANGTFTMNGGTIHVQTTNGNNAYGTYFNGVVTINGGTIHVEAAGTAYGINYAGSAEAEDPGATVNDGKFNITGSTAYVTDDSEYITIQGGWYNTNNNLASRVSAPYHVFNLDDATYNYEVALGYTLTWTTDGDALTGTYTSGTTKVGTTIVAPNTPTKTGHTFAGWSPAVAATMPAANTTYTATWTVNNYTVTVARNNTGYGTVSASSVTSVPYGSAITVNGNKFTVNGTTVTATPAAATAQYTYTFSGWTNAPGTVEGDMTVTANFTRTTNTYTILWKSEDGSSTLETDASQEYGAATSFGGSTPTKPTTSSYTYTFDGWATSAGGAKVYEIDGTPTVTGNATYYAHFSATDNVASVTVGGATTYYTTIGDAFTAANGAAAAPTIKILKDVTSGITTGFSYTGSYNCTLDLNNHTVTGNVAGKLLDINASGKTFTITDNSGEKGGIWQNECVTAARIYAVYLTDGSLVLNNGTVRAENKALDSFTSLSDEAKTYLATAVVVSQSKSFTMNNGKIIAEGIYTAYALHNAGTSRINNGEIKAVALRSYGGYVRAIYTSKGTTTVNGGTVTATKSDSYNNTYIYGIYVSGGTLSIPAASTLTANVTAYNRAYGLYVTGGTANVYGGTFNVTANNSRSYGIFATGGTTTFSSPVVLNVKSVGGTISSGIMVSSTATVNVEGGTFNVGNHVGTKRGSVYGVYHYANTSTYKAGTTNISGGEFKVVGSSTVYALLVESTATTASCNVSGGKFHVTGTSETYLPIASTTPTSMIAITGGEFNEKAAGSDFKTNVSGFLDAPYYTFDLASDHADYSDGYRFEVAEGYTLTWTTDGDALTGSYTSGTTKVGTTIVAPNTPTKTGYTFSAWTPAVAATMPEAHTEYTATWGVQTLRFTTAGNWNVAANWTPACVPTIAHPVILEKEAIVNVTDAQAQSVVIDQSSGKTGQLILEAGKELVVATTVKKTTDGSNRLATGENDLVFNSTSGAGLGALVMGTHDGTNNATVNFATLSNGEEDNTASDAQYVGTPFGNHPKMLYQFYNSWMYKFINTGVPGWTRVDGEDGLDAFQGYCIFSADGTGHTYWMQGTLVASEDQTISLIHNGGDGSNANNENMLANSWMAPIQIRAFDASDFTNADATIYIYNTGSPDDYRDNKGATSTGTQAGQYSLYTVNTCPTTAIIPSMQAFSVYTHGSTPSISLDYSKIVYDPAVAGSVVPGRNRAPQRTETDEPEKMRLYIGAESGYGDMLYMLEREDFAEGFENGWDGRKMFGEDVAPQLYAFTPDGNMAINCIPTFEGQLLGFRKGAQDNTYTFTFEYDGDNMWYLNDLKEQTSTLISAFDSYTFTSEADDTEARFIISRSPIHSTPTAVESATGAQQPAIRKIVINDHVFIIRNGLMYDVTGIMVR